MNPVFWTLAIEFQFYFLVSVIFGFISHDNRKILLGVNIFLAFLAILIPYDFLVFSYLGLFLTGISAFQYRAGLIGRRFFLGMLLVASLATWSGQGLDKALIALLSGILISFDFDAVTRKIRPLLTFGTISYSLYLTHVPIGGRVVNFGKRYVETQAQEFLLSFIGLGVSIIFAAVFYRLIEKPVQTLSSNIRYKS